MITSPDGKILKSGIDHEAKKLRGKRLNEIRELKNRTDLDPKDQAKLFRTELDWFMSKVNTLYLAQEAMMQEGKWNKSLISVGVTNGLIMAMAIFLEEQSEPPYMKIPENLDKETEKIVSEESKAFQINLTTQLEAIVCMGEDGYPKGYQHIDGQAQAWMQWRVDTINHLKRIQFEIPEINAAIERIDKFNKELFGED